jgi:hypothetical protein
MSNEITYQISLKRTDFAVTSNVHTFNLWTKILDQSLKRHYDGIMSIGTSEESPTFTDITSNGILLMLNLASANFVQWGVATTVYTGRMLFGESAGPFRLETGKTLFLKSDTAASDVRLIHYAA